MQELTSGLPGRECQGAGDEERAKVWVKEVVAGGVKSVEIREKICRFASREKKKKGDGEGKGRDARGEERSKLGVKSVSSQQKFGQCAARQQRGERRSRDRVGEVQRAGRGQGQERGGMRGEERAQRAVGNSGRVPAGRKMRECIRDEVESVKTYKVMSVVVQQSVCRNTRYRGRGR